MYFKSKWIRSEEKLHRYRSTKRDKYCPSGYCNELKVFQSQFFVCVRHFKYKQVSRKNVDFENSILTCGNRYWISWMLLIDERKSSIKNIMLDRYSIHLREFPWKRGRTLVQQYRAAPYTMRILNSVSCRIRFDFFFCNSQTGTLCSCRWPMNVSVKSKVMTNKCEQMAAICFTVYWLLDFDAVTWFEIFFLSLFSI